MARKRAIRIKTGSKAKFTKWGLLGCSHGMYSDFGYNFWVYGIKGLISLEITEYWGKIKPHWI